MKNILLVDGYSFIRHILRGLINVREDMRVVAEVKDANTAIQAIQRDSVDVIVVDVSIPEKNGLETFNDIHQLAPDIPAVIIGGNAQGHYVANFMHLGCKGYLTKHCDDGQVIEAINVVGEGKEYIRPASLYSVMNRYLKNKEIPEGLSARELQIFFKLVMGKSIETMAKELNVSASTVSVFRSKILKKMRLRSNADLIMYAVSHNLVMSPHRMQQH